MLLDPEIRRQLQQALQNMDALHTKLRRFVEESEAEAKTGPAARARRRLGGCELIRLQLRTLLNELDNA